jgi:hypothetical protein
MIGCSVQLGSEAFPSVQNVVIVWMFLGGLRFEVLDRNLAIYMIIGQRFTLPWAPSAPPHF